MLLTEFKPQFAWRFNVFGDQVRITHLCALPFDLHEQYIRARVVINCFLNCLLNPNLHSRCFQATGQGSGALLFVGLNDRAFVGRRLGHVQVCPKTRGHWIMKLYRPCSPTSFITS